MSERTYTLDELDQPRWKQIVTRAFDGLAAKFVTGALLVVGTMGAASIFAGHIAEEKRRVSTLAEQAAAAAAIDEVERTMPELIDGLAMKLAKEPWQGDFKKAGLDSAGLLASHGVYFRAVQTEVSDPEATRVAAGLSAKDSVPLCLLRGDEGVEESKTCAPGSVCLGQLTERVSNLHKLHLGFDVLSARWTDELRSADGMRLGALGGTLKGRLAQATPEAHRVASQARYALVVVDEIPADLPQMMWGSRRELVQNYPHAARLALYDARTGEPLVKIRRELDPTMAPVVGEGAWVGAARRQAYGCTLGLELRSALTGR